MAFEAAAQLVLDHLRREVPMGLWSVTRVENDRQTHLYLGENSYDVVRGDSVPFADSYCVRMVDGVAPSIAGDAAAVPAYAAAPVNRDLDIAAYAGRPIVEPDGSLFGAICGLDAVARPDLAAHGPLLQVLTGLLDVALAADRALLRAEVELRSAQASATTDALTGVRNRRGWDLALAELDAEYARLADPTVVAVIDLDGLKPVNDGPGGHAAGDELLRRCAAAVQGAVRDADVVARTGGDEFGVILRRCPSGSAADLLGRLSAALRTAGISASVGWAAVRVPGGVTDAVRLADQRMYRAKRQAAARAGDVVRPRHGAHGPAGPTSLDGQPAPA